METNLYPRPLNFVAEINGHLIVRNDHGKCDIWTRGTGWWAFGVEEWHARALCEHVVKSAV